jgi:hypothetical protein
MACLCNLYSLTKGQQVIRELSRAMVDRTGNMPLLPGIFPDYAAPIVRNQPDGRELTTARWGMPSPVFALKGRNSDSGVTNVRSRQRRGPFICPPPGEARADDGERSPTQGVCFPVSRGRVLNLAGRLARPACGRDAAGQRLRSALPGDPAPAPLRRARPRQSPSPVLSAAACFARCRPDRAI